MQNEIQTKELNTLQLSQAFEKLRRDFQSSKDKSVKETNARLDAMQEQINNLEKIVDEVLEIMAYERAN